MLLSLPSKYLVISVLSLSSLVIPMAANPILHPKTDIYTPQRGELIGYVNFRDMAEEEHVLKNGKFKQEVLGAMYVAPILNTPNPLDPRDPAMRECAVSDVNGLIKEGQARNVLNFYPEEPPKEDDPSSQHLIMFGHTFDGPTLEMMIGKALLASHPPILLCGSLGTNRRSVDWSHWGIKNYPKGPKEGQ